jgi:hypothetical protein
MFLLLLVAWSYQAQKVLVFKNFVVISNTRKQKPLLTNGLKHCLMNPLIHFFSNFLLARSLFGIGWEYAPIIFVFSIVLDLDHIPYFFRQFKGLRTFIHIGVSSRSRFQELYGLTAISMLASIGYFFFNRTLLKVIMLCMVLHFTLDFLAGHTRPLYPYSKDEVFLSVFKTFRTRAFVEAFLTILLGVILWLSFK